MSITAVCYPDKHVFVIDESGSNGLLCCVFFLCNIGYAGHWFLTLWKRQIIHPSFLQCAACALWPLWLIRALHWCCDCAHEAQFVCRDQTCDWCFNGDGTQASGELRVHGAARKWPRWHCGSSPLSSSRGASGKLCPCSPLQVRCTYWACWAFSLGAGT